MCSYCVPTGLSSVIRAAASAGQASILIAVSPESAVVLETFGRAEQFKQLDVNIGSVTLGAASIAVLSGSIGLAVA